MNKSFEKTFESKVHVSVWSRVNYSEISVFEDLSELYLKFIQLNQLIKNPDRSFEPFRV